MRNVSVFLLSGWFAAAAVLAAVPADLLRHVPDQTPIVVVADNPQKTVDMLRAYVLKVDPEADVDELTAAAIFGELPGGADAYDLTAPVVAATDVDSAEPILITKVKDADAWRSAAGAEEMSEAPNFLSLPHPMVAAAAIRGDILVLASNLSSARAAVDASGDVGKRFMKFAEPYASDHFIMAMADVPALGDEFVMQLQQFEMMAPMMLTSFGLKPAAASLARYALSQIRSLVVDCDAVFLAGKGSAEILTLTKHAYFKTGSGWAKYFGDIQPPSKSMLRALPAKPAPITLAFEWVAPEGYPTFSEAVMEQMLATLPDDPSNAEMRDMLQRMMQANKGATGANGIVFAGPNGELGVAGHQFMPNPQQMFELMREINDPNMLQAFSNMFVDMQVNSDITTEDKVISGRQARITRMSVVATGMPSADMFQTMLYDGDTAVTISAPTKHGLATASGSEASAMQGMEMLLADVDSMPSRDVQAALKMLPENASMAALFDVEAAAKWALMVAGKMGAGPADRSPGAAPAQRFGAMGVKLSKLGVQAVVALPSDAIGYVVREVKAIEEADSRSMSDEADGEMDGM